MNKESFNNSVIVRHNHDPSGVVLLERIDERCWRAEQWSAFYVRLILPENSCRFYRDEQGCAVAELLPHNIWQLSHRLEMTGDQLPNIITFVVPCKLRIPEAAFTKWRNNLPTIQTEK